MIREFAVWDSFAVNAMVVFINTQKCQHWHYCQICIPTYLQFSSLYAPHDVSKFKVRYQWV